LYINDIVKIKNIIKKIMIIINSQLAAFGFVLILQNNLRVASNILYFQEKLYRVKGVSIK
jgi:hypothetical protein